MADDNIKMPPNTIIFWGAAGGGKMSRSTFRTFLLSLAFFLLAASLAWGRSGAAGFPVDYALADGTRLTGYLSVPQGYHEGKSYPAVLLIHGGRGDGQGRLNRAEGFLRTRPVKKFLCPDYVVFSAAYHSDYFGGPQEIESMAVALATLAGLPQVDPGRIAALGVSHGGYLALMCAVHPQIMGKIKAAVSVSGVVDVGAFLRYRYRPRVWWKPDTGLKTTGPAGSPTVRALGWPPERDAGTRENYARLSVLTYLDNLQVPVLVIHGEKDNLVPVSQARSLRQALEQQGKPGEYLEVPTGKVGGHFIFVTSKAAWAAITAFLQKYL
jgi:dipeptidyl aminopeptidase/acylaminoacyl peptidase